MCHRLGVPRDAVGIDAESFIVGDAVRGRFAAKALDVALTEPIARVVDPVVNLELNPCRCKKVQRTRGQEVFSGEQRVAHRERIRLIE